MSSPIFKWIFVYSFFESCLTGSDFQLKSYHRPDEKGTLFLVLDETRIFLYNLTRSVRE